MHNEETLANVNITKVGVESSEPLIEIKLKALSSQTAVPSDANDPEADLCGRVAQHLGQLLQGGPLLVRTGHSTDKAERGGGT